MTTPKFVERYYMLRVIEHYYMLREIVARYPDAGTVPPELLRQVLDYERGVRNSETGDWYTRCVKVSKAAPAAMIKLIADAYQRTSADRGNERASWPVVMS